MEFNKILNYSNKKSYKEKLEEMQVQHNDDYLKLKKMQNKIKKVEEETVELLKNYQDLYNNEISTVRFVKIVCILYYIIHFLCIFEIYIFKKLNIIYYKYYKYNLNYILFVKRKLLIKFI